MNASRLIKAAAAVALAAGAALAVPATAQALSYTPTDDNIIVSSSTVTAGGTVTLTFGQWSFNPGQTVSFTLTGEGASGATLATFRTLVDDKSTTKVAGDDGSLSLAVTFPASARGTYTLTGSTADPAWSKTWVFTIEGTQPAASGLATTGSTTGDLLTLWVGAGALAFLGGGIAVAAAVRKQRNALK